MKVCPTCQSEYDDSVDFCASDGMKLRVARGETSDPLIGRALDGRWVIEEKLGEGGMGAVYRGHQKSVNRTVAIKTLRPQLVDSDEFVSRFFREAQIAANVAHPNCVTILDYGESDDGTLFLAMEFLEGELLTDRIEAGTLTVKQVVEVGTQVASALSAAHDQHIVHRDLKPDNIFLMDVPGGATFVKVLDFGIAKMLDSNTQVTKTGMIFGTPEYMSPEQCRGDKIDGRSDLYALGCILYELVGGRTPFKATTPMAVLLAHVNQDAPKLVEGGTASMIPASLEAIIMRLLEKSPDKRFASATELRVALEAELQRLENPSARATASQEIVAREPSGPAMAFDETAAYQSGELDIVEPAASDTGVASRSDLVAAAAGGPKPSGSSRLVMVALVMVVMCVLLAGGVFAVVSQDRSAEEPDAPGTDLEVVALPDNEPSPAVVEEASNEVPAAETEEPAANEEPPEVAEVTPPPEPEPEPKKSSAKKPKPTPKKTEPARKVEPEPEPKKPKQTKTATAPKPVEIPSEPVPQPRRPKNKIEETADKAGRDIKKGVRKVLTGADRKLDDILDDGLMEE